MATTCEVVVFAADAPYAAQSADAAFAELDRLDGELSRFVPTSDISQLNRLAAGHWLRVGPAAWDCLQLADRVRQATGGAFDVTLGSGSLQIDPANHAVGWAGPPGRVDLGGIGKGYAVDQMAAILRDWKIESALVHAGQSSVLAIGSHGVSVRDPRDESRSPRPVALHNQAFSGSGTLRHGQHIVDPRTGQARARWAGAWCVAPTTAESDALSTAFMVMAADEIERFIGHRPDVAAMLLPDSAAAELAILGTIGS